MDIKRKKNDELFPLRGDLMHKMVTLLLYDAILSGADRIIFGVPPEDYSIIEDNSPKYPMTEEELKYLGYDNYASFEESLQSSDDENDYILTPNSPVKKIPVWFCSKRKCWPSEGIPLYLFTSVIDDFFHHVEEGMNIKEGTLVSGYKSNNSNWL